MDEEKKKIIFREKESNIANFTYMDEKQFEQYLKEDGHMIDDENNTWT